MQEESWCSLQCTPDFALGRVSFVLKAYQADLDLLFCQISVLLLLKNKRSATGWRYWLESLTVLCVND